MLSTMLRWKKNGTAVNAMKPGQKTGGAAQRARYYAAARVIRACDQARELGGGHPSLLAHGEQRILSPLRRAQIIGGNHAERQLRGDRDECEARRGRLQRGACEELSRRVGERDLADREEVVGQWFSYGSDHSHRTTYQQEALRAREQLSQSRSVPWAKERRAQCRHDHVERGPVTVAGPPRKEPEYEQAECRRQW